MKRTTLFLIISLSIFIYSCKNDSTNKDVAISYEYNLVKTKKNKTFKLDSETRYNAFYMYNFKDSKEREYLSFLNYQSNQILFYDLDNCNFLFKIEMEREGANGISLISGYYIKDFDNIYVSSYSYPGLIKIDTTEQIIQKIPYGITNEGYQVVPSYAPASHPFIPPVLIENQIFITQAAADHIYPANKTPISIAIDTTKQTYKQLPFLYGDALTEKHYTQAGETRFSRIFNGKNFIYSFYANEEIFITSFDHSKIEKKQIKSKYIQKIELKDPPSDINFRAKQNLEIARYGDLIFDEYRNVYYRFVYPETELDNNKQWLKASIFGRNKFSIIILDKQFNIIGETLFPEGIYNSYVFFINKEGLYISKDYQINYNQTEDSINFDLFDLIKNT